MASIDCLDKITIAAPIEQVFETVLNYPRWHTWFPVYRCDLVKGEQIAIGSHIRHRFGYKSVAISEFLRSIDSITPNQQIHESYIGGDLLGTGIWEFTEQNGLTTASYHCMVTSNNPVLHISFLLIGKMSHRAIYKPLLKKLKMHCEKG